MERENSDMDMNQIMAKVTGAIENTYFPHLVQDYASWADSGVIELNMTREFAEGLHYSIGRNYIKIISSRHGINKTVHSFIVIKPTKGFEVGDILKAAGWNAPATNFKRGNVFEPASLSAVRWTGC